jgi:hypothetical protein
LIKGCWDPTWQAKRYARFYFGLNVIGQEAVTPVGLHSIPIPFMRHDHGLLRYKTFKFPETYSGYKIRCDQELKRLEKLKLSLHGKPDTALVMLTDTYVKMLKYISEGPYDSNRG